MQNNKTLEAREERFNLVKKYYKKYQVITLKANIPGPNKNIDVAYLLINLFNNLFVKKFKIIKTIYKDSFDGPYYMYLLDKSRCIKMDLINLEESNPLGRFIDIDCFYDSYISMHRNSPRKCFICNNDAIICSRNKSHSLDELIDYINSSYYEYIYTYISNSLKESILEELNLDTKFGLVSKVTSGSHKDMDYNLMKNSVEVIVPYILDMFKLGLNNKSSLTNLFYEAKSIGINADNAMFNATNNVNTYQGLIFSLGVISASVGHALKYNQSYKKMLDNIKIMVSKTNHKKGALNQAYKKYHDVTRLYNKYNLADSNDLRFMLMDLIIHVNDTIFIKRCPDKFERIKFRNKMKVALKNKDCQLINQLNEESECQNYSFGGCADLLVVAIYLKKVMLLLKD